MGYLQLAENGNFLSAGRPCDCGTSQTRWCSSGDCAKCCKGITPTRTLSMGGVDYYQNLAETTDPRELYIFVPDDETGLTGQWVREDFFDDLPEIEWQKTMVLLDRYQDQTQLGFFGKKARARREARQERRQQRKDLKAQSKATAREQRTAGGGFMGKVSGLVDQIFGGGQQPEFEAGFDITSGQAPTGFIRGQADTQPFYMKPAFIIGSLVVVGGAIYLATRKRK